MTPPDDLKIGSYVAVVNIKHEQTCHTQYSYDGTPLKLLAKSLPFLSVTDGKAVYALDVREVDVKKVTPHYVKQMQSATEVLAKERRRRRKKPKKDPKVCPRCGEGVLKERLTGGNKWVTLCPVCDYMVTQ